MKLLKEDNNENAEATIRNLFSNPNGGIEAVRRYMSARFNINEIVFPDLINNCHNEIRAIIDRTNKDANTKEEYKEKYINKFNSEIDKKLNEYKNKSIQEKRNAIILIKNKLLKSIYEKNYNKTNVDDIKDKFNLNISRNNFNEEKFKKYLFKLYLDVFQGDVNNTNIAIERIINGLKEKYEDDYEELFSNKDIMEKEFNKCLEEIKKFNEAIEKLRKEKLIMEKMEKSHKNKLLIESENNRFSIDDLNRAFAQGSIEGVNNLVTNRDRFQNNSTRTLGNGELENTRINSNDIEVNTRLDLFNQKNISNDTLTFICNMDISKYEKEEERNLLNEIKTNIINAVNNKDNKPITYQEIIRNGNIDIDGSRKNFLDILKKEDWNKLYNTLNVKSSLNNVDNINDEKEKAKEIKKGAKHIVEIVKKITFDSMVSKDVKIFRKKLKDSIPGKVVLGTYIFRYWGDRRLNIFDDYIKRRYLENIRNDNVKILNNINIIDVYRSMDAADFWNNVCVISCYNKETFRKISSLIYQISKDNINITSTGNIEVGLNTQSIMFTVYSKDKNEGNILLDRKGKELIEESDPDYNLYREIGNKINRYYFILVTEGYFQVGGLLNKGLNMFKKMNNLKSDSSFLGLTGKGDRAY